MPVDIDLVDGSLYSKLAEKADQIPERLVTLINTVSLKVQNSVKDAAPKITSNLEASTSVESTGPFSSRVYPDEGVAPYALYVILGTSPHIIKGKPYLYWEGADHPVRQVMHPGSKANPYFEKGYLNSQSDVESAKQEFRDWLMNLD